MTKLDRPLLVQPTPDTLSPRGPSTPRATSVASPRPERRDDPRVWAPPVPVLLARWRWVVVGAMALGLAGAIAPNSAESTASATLQMTSANLDSLRAKQVGQTLERTVLSEVVLATAAQARGIDEPALASRVRAQWQTDTDLVTITVTGGDQQGVVQDANAVADAVIQVGEGQSSQELSDIRDASNRLLKDGALADAGAEEARRVQLGSGVASRQDSALATSTSVVILDRALEGEPAGLSRSVRFVLGVAAGSLLAAGLALVIPLSRRRARTVREAARLSENLRVQSTDGAIGDLAGRMVESGHADLAVVALEGSDAAAQSLAHDVAQVVRSHGLKVAVLDGTSEAVTETSLSRSGRHHLRGSQEADVLITVVPDQQWAVRMLAGQSGLRSAIVGQTGHTVMGDIWRVSSILELSQPTVVLTS